MKFNLKMLLLGAGLVLNIVGVNAAAEDLLTARANLLHVIRRGCIGIGIEPQETQKAMIDDRIVAARYGADENGKTAFLQALGCCMSRLYCHSPSDVGPYFERLSVFQNMMLIALLKTAKSNESLQPIDVSRPVGESEINIKTQMCDWDDTGHPKYSRTADGKPIFSVNVMLRAHFGGFTEGIGVKVIGFD